METKEIFVILWADEASREYGELQAICATQELAIFWCKENDYTYKLEDSSAEADVVIEKQTLFQTFTEIKKDAEEDE